MNWFTARLAKIQFSQLLICAMIFAFSVSVNSQARDDFSVNGNHSISPASSQTSFSAPPSSDASGRPVERNLEGERAAFETLSARLHGDALLIQNAQDSAIRNLLEKDIFSETKLAELASAHNLDLYALRKIVNGVISVWNAEQENQPLPKKLPEIAPPFENRDQFVRAVATARGQQIIFDAQNAGLVAPASLR